MVTETVLERGGCFLKSLQMKKRDTDTNLHFDPLRIDLEGLPERFQRLFMTSDLFEADGQVVMTGFVRRVSRQRVTVRVGSLVEAPGFELQMAQGGMHVDSLLTGFDTALQLSNRLFDLAVHVEHDGLDQTWGRFGRPFGLVDFFDANREVATCVFVSRLTFQQFTISDGGLFVPLE